MGVRNVRVWESTTGTYVICVVSDSTLIANPPPVNIHVEDINVARKEAGLQELLVCDCSIHGRQIALCVHPRLGIWNCSVCVREAGPYTLCIQDADGKYVPLS